MKQKLEAELPGIANRCLSAYRRLCERGKFIQPASGSKLARDVAGKSNPFEAFIQERCMLEPLGMVQCSVLLGCFHLWCEENGRLDLVKRVSTPFNLTKRLKKEVRALAELDDTYRPHGKQRHYLGIRLKTRAELDGVDGEVIKIDEKKAEITEKKVEQKKVEEKKVVARPSWRRI